MIPAYNEQPRIGTTLDKIVRYLKQQSYKWEIIVVDDGSTDGTDAIVAGQHGRDNRIRLVKQVHIGKGGAVRRGMLAARGKRRMLCDADLAMPIVSLDRFLQKLSEGYDIAIGSREIAGANRFNEPSTRHWIGRVFNWVVRILAVRRFQDTQCGYKCFTSESAQVLFGLQRTKGFGFDVEILFLAQQKGLSVSEIPIDWYHQPGSKVRPIQDGFAMFKDVLALRLMSLCGRYNSTGESLT